MTPEMITSIYAYTAIGVAIILAAAGLGSALGWGIICSKYLEGIARQPEMRPQLMGQMLFTGGLMAVNGNHVCAFAQGLSRHSTHGRQLVVRVAASHFRGVHDFFESPQFRHEVRYAVGE